MTKDLAIVVVTYNSREDISDCLDAVERELAGVSHEVFVIDNASEDGTQDLVKRQWPQVRLIANEANEGFPAASNQGLRLSQARHVCLLNPDTVVGPGALARMMAVLDAQPRVGLCGPTLIDEKGNTAADLRRPTVSRIWRRVFVGQGFERQRMRGERVEVLSGAAMMIRGELLRSVGLLDEELFWREDVDYCARVQREGWTTVAVRDATVMHKIGRSARSNSAVALEKPIESSIRYFIKHEGRFAGLLVMVPLALQTIARCGLWVARAWFRNDPAARRKAGILGNVLKKFPQYYRSARPARARRG